MRFLHLAIQGRSEQADLQLVLEIRDLQHAVELGATDLNARNFERMAVFERVATLQSKVAMLVHVDCGPLCPNRCRSRKRGMVGAVIGELRGRGKILQRAFGWADVGAACGCERGPCVAAA